MQIRLLQTELEELNTSTNLKKYLDDLQRLKAMLKARDHWESELTRPPTFLQTMLRYPKRLMGEKFEATLEVMRDSLLSYLRNKNQNQSQKHKHSTTRYIWRTHQDKKVRPDHAQREGIIFRYDSPPPGGNPGEAYGCRCWAEPLPDNWTAGLGDIFKKP